MQGRRRAYARHDLLFIPPFVPHAFHAEAGPSEHIAVHFDFAPDVPRTPARLNSRLPYAVRFTHDLAIARQQRWFSGHRGERVLREIVAVQKDAGPLGTAIASAQLSAVLLGLLGERVKIKSAPRRSRDEARVRSVVNFMRAHLSSPVVHRDLEKISGLSTSRLQAVFSDVTGYPPLDYLRRMRVEEARRLLADHRLSVKEVAARTGFRDTSHFSKVFRSVDGLSPAHYRDALLAGRQEK